MLHGGKAGFILSCHWLGLCTGRKSGIVTDVLHPASGELQGGEHSLICSGVCFSTNLMPSENQAMSAKKKKKYSESALKLVIYSRKSGNAEKYHIRDTDDQVCCHLYNVVPFL